MLILSQLIQIKGFSIVLDVIFVLMLLLGNVLYFDRTQNLKPIQCRTYVVNYNK